MNIRGACLGFTLLLGCATDSNAQCIGNGCTEEPRPTRGPGNYISAYRQGVWNMATAPGGSCERACCEAPGGEFGLSGVWSERDESCAWKADILQLRACESWCYDEIAEASAADLVERNDAIEGRYAQTSGALHGADGVIEILENMGSQILYLSNMEISVVPSKDPSQVRTIHLGLGRSDEDPNTVGIYLSPKQVKSSGWKYLECHMFGLYVGGDWSVGGAKGADGSWLRFDADHEGSVLSNGEPFETVSSSADVETIREWASAEDSGGQVCFDKFTLSASQKAKVLEFLSLGQDGAATSPPVAQPAPESL